MDINKLNEVISLLRNENSDNQYYEVKAAAKGFPQNLRETISAFANTPGGGVLVLGLDENNNFEISGVYDSKECQQALAAYAKKEFRTLVSIKTTLIVIGEKKVVWAEVTEADKTQKPVKLKGNGKSYIRLYDGDYELSEEEEQLFIAHRGSSHFDTEIVPSSSLSDLDETLTKSYITNRKEHSRALRKMPDDELLFRTGIMDKNGALTKAGVAALGKYPQQFFPNFSIKVSVRKRKRRAERVRAINVNSIDGPIPMMLEEAVKWVANNSDELSWQMPNGHVSTVREYPLASIRELISNALIHRDLNPLSMFQSITLTMEEDRLILSNPGGLYGLTIRELGHTESKTRNARLAEICQYVRGEDGYNVIEKLGSGIPFIMRELASLNMPAATFIDGGIYFTAVLKSAEYQPGFHTSSSSGSAEYSKPLQEDPLPHTPKNEGLIVAALSESALSRKELEIKTELTVSQVRYMLKKLIEEGKIYKTKEGSSPASKYALCR